MIHSLIEPDDARWRLLDEPTCRWSIVYRTTHITCRLGKSFGILSDMERNFEGRPSADDAAARLRDLASDRQTLADSVQVPRTLLAALGGVAAWWVAAAATANPGENYEPPASGWLGLVAGLVVLHLIRRETGIGFRRLGTRATMASIAILMVCLTLFSISLGFVSLGARWAVTLTSMCAFGLVTWLAGIVYRSALDQLRHD